MRICLCLNCLADGATAVSVGPDKGHQMDSYRDTLDLCGLCKTALLAGDFATLAERHSAERIIRVGGRS